MGIYINMEMPVTCCHCTLMGYDPDREWFDSMARTGAHICVLTGELIDNTKREEHCPLVPVPPHGRLIDADALHKLFEDQWHYLQVLDWNENPTAEAMQSGINWCINTMHDDAPTIIPASDKDINVLGKEKGE